MSTKDDSHYVQTFHDFDIFKDCFGDSKIMPTDIDFIVERRNYFLVMELKPDDKELSKGQEIMLQNLSRISNFTVVIIFHTAGREMHETLNVTAAKVFPAGTRTEINNEDLKRFVTAWYETANS